MRGETGALVRVLSEDHSRAGDNGHHILAREPYGYRWYRAGGLDYLLRRSEIESKRQAGDPPALPGWQEKFDVSGSPSRNSQL